MDILVEISPRPLFASPKAPLLQYLTINNPRWQKHALPGNYDMTPRPQPRDRRTSIDTRGEEAWFEMASIGHLLGCIRGKGSVKTTVRYIVCMFLDGAAAAAVSDESAGARWAHTAQEIHAT